jgi:Domain of unknown function (DUF4304)
LSGLIDPELFRKARPGSSEYIRYMRHPDLKTIRKRVVKTLVADLEATLEPLGYERKGTEWRKASKFGRSILQLQKSRYGFCLYINVGRLPRFVLLPRTSMSGTPDGFVLTRFQSFCPELSQIDHENDSLHYVKLHEDAAFRDAVVTIVRSRLVPWIEARHKRSSLIFLPLPRHMTKVPLFQSRSRQSVGISSPGSSDDRRSEQKSVAGLRRRFPRAAIHHPVFLVLSIVTLGILGVSLVLLLLLFVVPGKPLKEAIGSVYLWMAYIFFALLPITLLLGLVEILWRWVRIRRLARVLVQSREMKSRAQAHRGGAPARRP